MHLLKYGCVRMEKFRAEMTYIDRVCQEWRGKIKQNTINGLKKEEKIK